MRRLAHISTVLFSIFALGSGAILESAQSMNHLRAEHSATLLPDGRVLVAGGVHSFSTTEIYDSMSNSWSEAGKLNNPRSRHAAVLLPSGEVLVTGGSVPDPADPFCDPNPLSPSCERISTTSVEVFDPTTQTWSEIAPLTTARERHTATLLPDGRVLVVGGEGPLDSTEVFDRDSGTWSAAAPMSSARARHSATLLADGRVLVAGGATTPGSAEIYDPASDSWSSTEPLNTPRDSHSATLLPSGEVLVAGGRPETAIGTDSSEVWDPATGMWAERNSYKLNRARRNHTAVLLPSGKVLAAGGYEFDGDFWRFGDSVELFDPASRSWAMVNPLETAREGPTATLLPTGKVLFAGGELASRPIAEVELYPAPSGSWIAATPMSQARSFHTATLLPSGRVLVVGGEEFQNSIDSVELYDPATDSWSTQASLNVTRDSHTATLLPTGQVLVVGGFRFTGQPEPPPDGLATASAELFDAETGIWTPTGSLNAARGDHTATVLQSGKVLVVGGAKSGDILDEPDNAVPSSEIYDPGTGLWTETPPLNTLREEGHSATLLPDGRVLVVGGWNGLGWMTSAEAFDSRSGTWSETAPMNHARGFHTATSLVNGKVLVAGGSSPGESLTTSELYGPESGTWAETGVLSVGQSGHTATLLRDQTVLAVDGAGLSPIINSALVYDPTSGQWSEIVQPQAPKQGHTATLLRDGRVLFAGGYDPNQGASGNFAELFVPDQYSPARRPIVTSVAGPLTYGDSLAVTGTGFNGDSEASDGSTDNSPVNYPVVQLQSVENDYIAYLDPEPLSNFSDDPLTLDFAQLPVGFDPGWHHLTVITAGVPSVSELVEVTCSVAITGEPEDQTGAIEETVTFEVETSGGRFFQWRRNGIDIAGATAPSYTTTPIEPADSGSTFTVIVGSGCTSVESAPAVLTVEDFDSPEVSVESPSGGEYWLLSDAGEDSLPGTADDPPPRKELITWSMTDNVRICRVGVSLLYSNDGGASYVEAPPGGGLPATFGPGGTCVFPGESTTSTVYTLPTEPPSGSPGSLYKVRVEVTDHAGLTTVAESANPFFIVEPNPDAFDSLILVHRDRLASVYGGGAADTVLGQLSVLAGHPRVQGFVVDLSPNSDFNELLAAWDGEPGNGDRANAALFGCEAVPAPAVCAGLEGRAGLHDTLRDLLVAFTGVRYVVLVGDDRILPFARLPDRTTLLPESAYPAGGDLTPGGSTVGQALAENRYLSDDPLGVLEAIRPEDLATDLFLPDLAIGRLVETPAEIIQTIAIYISQDGVLDLPTLESTTDHKVLVTGYDFLVDVAQRIESRWSSVLGDTSPGDPLAPVDGELIGADWGLGSVGARQGALREHLDGNGDGLGGGRPYGLVSLNGHATHFGEGVPGENPFDIQGLEAAEILGLDLSGSVVYAVGCHGGLPVPGSDPGDPDHSLDLVQTFLSRGAVAYVANSGYGWGLRHGIGYSERLVEILSEELTAGGTVTVGQAVERSKQRYFLETPRFDVYDEKSVMQWTLFGLPNYAVRTGIGAGAGAVKAEGPFSALSEAPGGLEVEGYGPVRIEARGGGASVPGSAQAALPAYLTQVSLSFDLSAPGIYTKYDASGNVLPEAPGCADPEGCYYTLNSLVERGTGSGDLPIQPYLIFDSRLAGTSQHGVLWQGGIYDEETGWVPVVGELISNSEEGVGDDAGASPRTRRIKTLTTRVVPGEEPEGCRPSDLELNRLLVPAGETVTVESADDRERIYRGIEVEVFYFNNTLDAAGNCDREGPELGEGPFGGEYHRESGPVVEWAVPVEDADGDEDGEPDGEVWRVVVVSTDNTVDGEGRGRWEPLELVDEDQDGTWTGSRTVVGSELLTYAIQAVDGRGNVSWLDFVTSELPKSGVDPEIPDAPDVLIELGEADLQLTVTDAPDPVAANATLIYTLQGRNLGPGTAHAVEVTANLPADALFLGALGDGWGCGESLGTVVCTRASLGLGAAPALSLLVAPPTEGVIALGATVMALESDPNPSNNADSESTTVTATATADLGIAKTDGGAVAVPTEPLSYTVTVTNPGPHPVTGATVVDFFPPELGGVVWSCVATDGSSCTVVGVGNLLDAADLLVGGEAIYRAAGTVSAEASGTLVNTAVVMGSVGVSDPDPSDNTATVVTPIDPEGCGELVLRDETILTAEVYEACRITVGPNLAVIAPGHLTLRARTLVVLTEDFSVGVDAGLTVEIDPSLLP